MSCCDSTISAQRDADLQVFFAPQSGFTFSTSQPTLRVWDASSSALSPLLTVEMVATPNGSAWSYDVDALELLVTRADLQALPDANLYFDITLLSNGVVYPFTGGDFDLQDDGSEGKGCGSQSFTVSLEGKQVPVLIQGGGLSRAMANGLQDLNTAVSEAQQASQDAEAAAQAAIAASANKLDTDGDNATTDILTNLQYLPAGSGSVPRSQKSKNDDVLNARDFGAVFDGVTDDTDAIKNSITSAILTGRQLDLDGPTVISEALAPTINAALPFAPAFYPGLTINGSNRGDAIIYSKVANDWLLDFMPGAPFKFVMGLTIRNLTIVGDPTVPNSSGIRIRGCYQVREENIHIIGLTGDGIRDRCTTGDADGNVFVSRRDVRVEDCLGWGWDGSADPGSNENSYLENESVQVQNCGTDETKLISGITNANPAVVTATAHGFVNGDRVYIGGVSGMSQVNTDVSLKGYEVAGATANTFQLQGVNSTSYGAFTLRQTTITSITKANPGVVTATAHGFSNGEVVEMIGVTGMTQVNGQFYVVANSTANTFTLLDQNDAPVNTTSFGTFTAGTVGAPRPRVIPSDPQSGGAKYKGQVGNMKMLALTFNKNVSFYVPDGGGSAQTLDLNKVTVENPRGIGVLVKGCVGIMGHQGQTYVNPTQAGGQCYFGVLLDGNSAAVDVVEFKQHTTRVVATNPLFTQFCQIGPNANARTIRAEDNIWLKFDQGPGQKRFSSNWQFDFNPMSKVVCVAADANTAYVIPSNFEGNGKSVPIRRRYSVGGLSTTGEIVDWQIGTVNITKPGADGLYQIYFYDNSNVIAAEASTTLPASDPQTGIMMKSDDFTRTWVGSLAVVGGSWLTTSAGYTKPIRLLTSQPGVEGSFFFNLNDRELKVKTSSSLPSAGTDANFGWKPDFEAAKSFDWPSIPSMGTTSTTLSGANGAVGNPGDPVNCVTVDGDPLGVWFSGDFTSSNTITAKAFNPTAGAVDLPAMNLRASYKRR